MQAEAPLDSYQYHHMFPTTVAERGRVIRTSITTCFRPLSQGGAEIFMRGASLANLLGEDSTAAPEAAAAQVQAGTAGSSAAEPVPVPREEPEVQALLDGVPVRTKQNKTTPWSPRAPALNAIGRCIVTLSRRQEE